MLGEARLKALAESIAVNGMRHPIVLFEDKILDGRNRYKAAKIAKYETKPDDFIDFVGGWDAAVAFVADENLERRDLDAHERAICAARLSKLGRGRPATEIRSPDRITQTALAEKLGTSTASVGRAKRVLDKGSPELIAAMENKEIAIEPAAELATLPVEQQRVAVAGGPEAVKKALGWQRRAMLSPVQKAVRRQQLVGNAWMRFAEALAMAREALSTVVSDEASPTEQDRVTAEMAIRDTRSVLDWAETLLAGGVTDAALKTFVEGEND